MSNDLRKFEGREVVGTRIEVANAGDGLSAALAVDPEELPLGANVVIVLDTVCDKVRYEKIKDSDLLIRVHRLKAGTATIVEKSLVAEVLAAQALKIEKAKGVERLNFDEPDDESKKDGDDDNGSE